MEAAQLVAHKTQPAPELTVSVRPLNVPVRGQLSFPCAMLLGHPTNAGGSLTHSSLVCQLGCLPMQPQPAAELKGKEKTSPRQRREGGGCRLPLGDSRTLAAAPELGGGEGRSWGCRFCCEPPHPWDPRKGPVGRCAVRGITGHPGSCTLEPSKVVSSPDTAAWVCVPVLPSSQQAISLGHGLRVPAS